MAATHAMHAPRWCQGLAVLRLLRCPRRSVSSLPRQQQQQQHVAAAVASDAAAAPATAAPSRLRSAVGLAMELSKARLSALVVMTSSAGYLAAGGPLSMSTFAAVCVGTTLCAASANTWNQLLERDRDGRMLRTRARPLPSGRCSPAAAAAWGVGSGVAGTAILALGANPLTAVLGAGNIALYGLAYTLLKPRSEINTWVGSVVGAIPPVMGWAAATGTLVGVEPLMLGATLFLWQFPHFFALAWLNKADYARGGYAMVPVNDPTGRRTASLILRYSLYLSAVPVVSTLTGATGTMFAVEGLALSGYLTLLASRFYRDRSNGSARAVFRCSLWYLPVLLFGFAFHSNRWSSTDNDTLGATTTEASWFADAVAKLRSAGRSVCVHEKAVEHNMDTVCPPVATQQAAQRAAERVDDLVVAAATTTTPQQGR